MVIIPERKAVFIHIIRTNGSVISEALREAFPKALVDIGSIHIHDKYTDLCETFRDYRFFSIARNPWDIFSSHYRWCEIRASENYRGCPEWVRIYSDAALRIGFNRTVKEWVRTDAMCKKYGFWDTYCGSEVDAIAFGDNMFSELESYLDTELSVNMDALSPPADDAMWGAHPDAVAIIEERCRNDIEQFGYVQPC